MQCKLFTFFSAAPHSKAAPEIKREKQVAWIGREKTRRGNIKKKCKSLSLLMKGHQEN